MKDEYYRISVSLSDDSSARHLGYSLHDYELIDFHDIPMAKSGEIGVDGYMYEYYNDTHGGTRITVIIDMSFRDGPSIGGHYDLFYDILFDCIKKDKLKEFLE